MNLAWFSSLTHLPTLTFLRHRFRQQPGMAISRAVLMGIVIVLLAVSLGPTGFFLQAPSSQFKETSAIPAICLFHKSDLRLVEEHLDSKDTLLVCSTPIIVLSLTYLIVSYLKRVVRISRPASEFVESCVRVKPGTGIKAAYRYTRNNSNESSDLMGKVIWSIPMALILLCYLILKAIYGLASSVIWEVRTLELIMSYVIHSC